MADIDPRSVIGEVLGISTAACEGAGFSESTCPFIGARCAKRSQRFSGSFPVCSIYRGSPSTQNLVCVCPKRFMATSFLADVVEHCWTEGQPEHLEYVAEVKMGGIGTVDYVVADLGSDRSVVNNFVSVELQAVDITGSYEPAYQALLNGELLERKPTYGFNWANVRKRYITQLISKGFFHQQWGSKIVSVVQDHVFNYFGEKLGFDEIAIPRADIVFLVYKYSDTESRGAKSLVLDRVFGTSHSSLMMRSLYSQTPPREDFCKRILDRAKR